MTNDELSKIAESIGTITEEQKETPSHEPDEGDEEEFDPEEYRRDTEEYDGGWDTNH